MNDLTDEEQMTQLQPEQAEALISQAFMGVMTQKDFDDSVIREYCVVECGEIYFNTPEEAESAVSVLDDWVQDTNQNISETVSDSPFPHLQIDSFKYHEKINAVTFVVFSLTEKGIRDQLSVFLDFCKTLPGIKKFDALILKTVEPVTWEKK